MDHHLFSCLTQAVADGTHLCVFILAVWCARFSNLMPRDSPWLLTTHSNWRKRKGVKNFSCHYIIINANQWPSPCFLYRSDIVRPSMADFHGAGCPSHLLPCRVTRSAMRSTSPTLGSPSAGADHREWGAVANVRRLPGLPRTQRYSGNKNAPPFSRIHLHYVCA